MGRTSKLTDQVEATIIKAVEHGLTLGSAASAAGIGRSTLHRWLKLGQEEEQPRYRAFRDAIKRTEAQLQQKLLHMIREHGEKTWQALAWLLERRWPEEWGRPWRGTTMADSDSEPESDSEEFL